MATGKNPKGTRTRKTTEGEPRERNREAESNKAREAHKQPTEGQSGTAEDLFWGGSDDQGEVQ